MGRATQGQLESYERAYRDLAGQLASIGYIASGSLALRYNRCGKHNCACHADEPRLHGPYWLFTAKVKGKTVNKRLSEREAELYGRWIANDRRARSLLAEMRALAAEAQPVILVSGSDDGPRTSGRERHSSSPEPRTRPARDGS